MLKHIQLQGYKSIRDLDLELKNINILIGANGSGKSNLISFFKLLRWMMQSPGSFQIFIGQSGGANALLFDGASVTPQMKACLTFETESGKNEYLMRLFHADGDTLIFAEEKYRYSNFSYNSSASWVSLDAGHREAKIVNTAAQGDKTAKTILGLIQNCTVYQFHNTSETARIKQRWNVDDNRYLREDAANLAPFLLRLRESNQDSYLRIVETIRLVAPFFSDFVLNPINNNVILQWREQDTDLIFNAYQASDGTLRTMALITLLLQPEQEISDVIIIDEPELGLHPYAISILAGLLQSISRHSQIILATQSTLFIDNFYPEDIIVVERKNLEEDKILGRRGNRPSIFHRLDPEKLQDWLEDYSLSELWHKNVIGGRPSK